jgi:hypothetical protein
MAKRRDKRIRAKLNNRGVPVRIGPLAPLCLHATRVPGQHEDFEEQE